MTLNVDKKNALKAWREADNKGKQMLENLYGKESIAYACKTVKNL